jgi:hypothetical protein
MWYPEDDDNLRWVISQCGLLVERYGKCAAVATPLQKTPVAMLSTGDFDVNKNEIWDGDIVEWQGIMTNPVRYVVKWYKGNRNTVGDGWFLYIYHRRRIHGKDVECYDSFIHLVKACFGWPNAGVEKPTVIGNVYENPELMENGNGENRPK